MGWINKDGGLGMLLVEETFEKYNYHIEDFSEFSSKMVIVQCDYCLDKIEKPISNFNIQRKKSDKDSCSKKECKGKKISDNVRAIVSPATPAIYSKALKEGLIEIFQDAGFCVTNPTCGACLGMSNGVLANGESCASTTNRNFNGRMGKGGTGDGWTTVPMGKYLAGELYRVLGHLQGWSQSGRQFPA
jgi:hypothetical protein